MTNEVFNKTQTAAKEIFGQFEVIRDRIKSTPSNDERDEILVTLGIATGLAANENDTQHDDMTLEGWYQDFLKLKAQFPDLFTE